jgi:hypothetical protein
MTTTITDNDLDDDLVELCKEAAQVAEYIHSLAGPDSGNGEDIRREAVTLLAASMICEAIRDLQPMRGSTRISKLFGGCK